MLENIHIKEHIIADEKYRYLFSVEEVNKLVLQGVPFREAYQQIGRQIEAGQFTYSTQLHHTHEGSIGNLCNPQIQHQMDTVIAGFGFEKAAQAIAQLLADAKG